jgi:hypothetical protein
MRAAGAWEQVPHLETMLEKIWHRVWCSRRTARRALSSGKLWRRRLSAREGESGEMRQGRESGCQQGSKGSWGMLAGDVAGVLDMRTRGSAVAHGEDIADKTVPR